MGDAGGVTETGGLPHYEGHLMVGGWVGVVGMLWMYLVAGARVLRTPPPRRGDPGPTPPYPRPRPEGLRSGSAYVFTVQRACKSLSTWVDLLFAVAWEVVVAVSSGIKRYRMSNSLHSLRGIKRYQAVSSGITRYPAVSSGIERYQVVSSGIKRYQTPVNEWRTPCIPIAVSSGIKRYQAVSCSVRRYQAVSSGIKRYPAVSSGIKRHQVVSRGIKRYEEVSGGTRRYQALRLKRQ